MTMPTWNSDDLSTIGGAEEVQIASVRPDGTLRPYVTIWAVRSGDDLYVRSAYGKDNPWYRHAKSAGFGRVRAAGVEHDVTFAEAAPDAQPGIDEAYHAKYDRHGPAIVNTVVGPAVAAVTIRLLPRISSTARAT